jgi:hypothetical protein
VKPDDIGKLNLGKQSFGCQRCENRFIIWKHVVKWKKYAEVSVNERVVYIDGFNNRKKRR